MKPDNWIFVAILLATGVKMIVDPEGFASISQELANAMRDVEETFGPDLSPAQRTGLRIAGLALIALAMLIVAVS
jgi:hypothetical protein